MATVGIPNLLNGLPRAAAISLLGMSIRGAWDALFPGPVWGVFNPGTTDEAVQVSSVVYVDIAGDSQVSDYPLQSGSFTSYNKVVTPNLFRVALANDGNEDERRAFLLWLEQNAAETSLFDVYCPDYVWPKATLVSYRISRSARNGATMLVADCVFQHVRELPSTYSTTNVPNPDNQSPAPTARVNLMAGEPASAGGDVAWQ